MAEEAGKLFAGGLSRDTTQESLGAFFSSYGEILDCVVMKDNETGRSRGFGFVTFKDPSSAELVLANGPHTLDGRTVDIKTCTPRGATNGGGDRKGGGGGNRYKSKEFPKIFLGGLPSTTSDNGTESDLENFFSKYGKVMEVVIMYDQESKRSRGFGFVSFETEESVDQLCSERFVTINGKRVECKKAEPRDGRPSNRGGGGGGRSQSWNNGGMSMGGMSGMGNGMMDGSYQGGWGGQQQSSYGAGGYGAASGYQGWGAPQGGYGYGGATQYSAQGGYGAAAATAYPGYAYGWSGATMASGTSPTTGMVPASGSYGSTGTGQEATTKGYGDSASSSFIGPQASTYGGRGGGQTGYHPYRRQ